MTFIALFYHIRKMNEEAFNLHSGICCYRPTNQTVDTISESRVQT